MSTTTIPNFSQRQVMLCFAYLAYTGEQITTSNPEATILANINTAMPQLPPIAAPNPLWQVVWGPAVYTVPGALFQDNLLMVFQNQTDPTQYALAVRGTNFVSNLDWLLEDFDVLQQMNWPLGTGGSTTPVSTPSVSESTSIGMAILLGLQDSTGNQSLFSFLMTAATTTGISLCVTGHSLGGCLAGTLALFLKQNQASWDGSGQSIVSAVTFAAPTAGNTAFATLSDTTFAGGPYPPNWDSTLGTTLDAVRNSFDVAPQAWIAANLSQQSGSTVTSPLFATYGNNLNFDNLSFSSFVAWEFAVQNFFPPIAAVLATRGYAQVQRTAAQLPGTFNTALAPASTDLVTYLKAFVAQAAWQHGNSYPASLGVPALLTPGVIVKS